MKLPLKLEYACRVMACLARLHGSKQLPHIDDLAQAEAVPANYLIQILNELRTGGLIQSWRGKQGGYALARPPSDISLRDIIQVMEGKLLEPNPVGEGRSAEKVGQVWGEVAAFLEEKTLSYSLEAFLSSESSEMYHI